MCILAVWHLACHKSKKEGRLICTPNKQIKNSNCTLILEEDFFDQHPQQLLKQSHGSYTNPFERLTKYDVFPGHSIPSADALRLRLGPIDHLTYINEHKIENSEAESKIFDCPEKACCAPRTPDQQLEILNRIDQVGASETVIIRAGCGCNIWSSKVERSPYPYRSQCWRELIAVWENVQCRDCVGQTGPQRNKTPEQGEPLKRKRPILTLAGLRKSGDYEPNEKRHETGSSESLDLETPDENSSSSEGGVDARTKALQAEEQARQRVERLQAELDVVMNQS